MPRILRRPLVFMVIFLLSLGFDGWFVDSAAMMADRLTPIYQIQGKGATTPLLKKWIDTYGVVTGVSAAGFYLQDPVGDDDPATSDGIYVYTQRAPQVNLGQCVELQRAYVDEFYEKTELSRLKAVTPSERCSTTALTPVKIPLARLAGSPVDLFEPYEGMLVQVENLTGIVQGPTKRFTDGEVEMVVLPAALLPYVPGGRVFQADSTASAALMQISNALGAQVPEASWGDRIVVGAAVDGVPQATGILDYNFGNYQLLLLPDVPIAAERQPPVEETGNAATPDDFTVCTFNLYGLGRGTAQFLDEVEYRAQVRKRALAIHDRLQDCLIIGVQETGTPADAANLSAELLATFGVSYTTTSLAGPQTGNPEFPLTNSLLTRSDRVQVQHAETSQACSSQDYEVIVLPGDCPAGQYAIFDRPPLVVDLTVTGAWGDPFALRVIVNHWKSKGGDETVNVVRREAQARHVATLVQARLDDDPAAHVIVLGDLNDYYQSKPVEALRTAVQPPLVHSYDFLAPLDRYSYIFNGASQVLDHLLLTANLLPLLAQVDPVHIDSNFPYPAHVDFSTVHHASDHDPVQLRFRPTGAAMLGGNLAYPAIHVQALDAEQRFVGEATTDAQGDFRIWNLTPGPITLEWQAPIYLELSTQKMTTLLQPGYNTVSDITVTHQATALGTAAVGVAPDLVQMLVVEKK